MGSKIDHKPFPDTDSNDETKTNKLDKEEPIYLSGCRPGHIIVPECEVFEEGEAGPELKLQECEKNRGHENFIKVEDFNENHLPVAMRTYESVKTIKETIARTVWIKVKYTSRQRPDTFSDSDAPYPYSQFRGSFRKARTGSGLIIDWVSPEAGYLVECLPFEPITSDCPCPECKKSDTPQTKYWEYRVMTAAHVVFDDSEAERTIIKCFYDSEENQDEVVTLYGVKIETHQSLEERYRSDVCERLLCVTHDEGSAEMIKSRIGQFRGCFHCQEYDGAVIVSHPHGCSKRITVGDMLYTTIHILPGYETGIPRIFPKDAFCYSRSEEGEVVCRHMNVKRLRKYYLKFKNLFHRETKFYHKRATYTLPKDAGYVMRFLYDVKGFQFPPGTKFTSRDGLDIPIPDNAIFGSGYLQWDIRGHEHDTFTYNVPTCPGSSGAGVPRHRNVGSYNMTTFIPHSGWDRQELCNRSCIGNSDSGFDAEYLEETQQDDWDA